MGSEVMEEKLDGPAIVRIPCEDARRYFLDQLRNARGQAQRNAEDFSELLFVFERLGSYLIHEIAALGDYSTAILQLAKQSSLGGKLTDKNRSWHSSSGLLYHMVNEARNSALHQGAKARHLTEHAIELAIVLEDALIEMDAAMRLIREIMVRPPVTAEEWQPISFVRQTMLTYSFSFLPVFISKSNEWMLLSDHAVAAYIHRTRKDRRKRMADSVKEAAEAITDRLNLIPAQCVSGKTNFDELFALGVNLSVPVLVHGDHLDPKQHPKDSVVGIVTAFDLL